MKKDKYLELLKETYLTKIQKTKPDKKIKTLHEIEPATAVAGYVGAVIATVVGRAAYLFYTRLMTASGRACMSYSKEPGKFKLCRSKYQITALEKYNAKLQSGMSKCNGAKNPEEKQKCIDKIKNKIEKNNEKIQNLKNKIKLHATDVTTHKGEDYSQKK